MIDLVLRYLLNHKEVSLKGIGTFSLRNVSSVIDFPDRLLYAPKTILEYSASASDSEDFHRWIENDQQLSAHTAKDKLEFFVKDFQQKLSKHKNVEWEGIGVFSKNEENLLSFQPAFDTFIGDPVKAEKIIRKDAEHYVKVGEEEKTNIEMEELLLKKQKRTIKAWWIFTIVLFLLGVAALWYFSSANKSEWNTQGNGSKIKPGKNEPTYKLQ